MAKKRIDELLVEQGLADSRSQAKALVLAGKVRLGTERLDKPGRTLAADARLTVEQPPRFVSRGGDKVEGFLKQFDIDVTGRHLLDVGASTGGFTDCCLQRGAISSTCVDVGRAQFTKLRQDARVTNMETLQPGDLPHDAYPLIVMDLSLFPRPKSCCNGSHGATWLPDCNGQAATEVTNMKSMWAKASSAMRRSTNACSTAF